jgi:DUF4097 and DUF4098 domain-containing protein YvlB
MKFLLTIVALVLGCGVYAQNNGEFTVPFSNPSAPMKLVVDIKTGTVIVKGTARKDVLVKYTSEKNEDRERDEDDDDDDRKHKVRVNVDIDNGRKSKDGLKKISGGSMDLEASEYQNTVKVVSDNWNESMTVTVEVPSTINMHVKTYNDGDLEVNNIVGVVELTNYNGAITAKSISGTVIAQTYNGDIKIVYDKLTPDTPLSYVNYNGDIDLTFPSTLKASVKMKTKQGEIYSGFDAPIQKSTPVTKNESKSGAYKVVIDDWVKMDINGGGPEITVKSYNGDIYIRKK